GRGQGAAPAAARGGRGLSERPREAPPSADGAAELEAGHHARGRVAAEHEREAAARRVDEQGRARHARPGELAPGAGVGRDAPVLAHGNAEPEAEARAGVAERSVDALV